MTENIRNTIRNLINEATVESDKYYYDIADKFYDRMIVELSNGNYIFQNDSNIIFKASVIDTNYANLFILFTSANTDKTRPTFGNNSFKAGYSFGTHNQYKVIIINNLKEDKQPQKGILKEGFIHEFIHYLDFQRSKGYKPKFTEKTTIYDYYNLPTEYNAYYQEAATYVVNLLNDEDMLKSFKEKYKGNYHAFYEWMIKSVLDKDFTSSLNNSNNIKLKKRIYNIYAKYLV